MTQAQVFGFEWGFLDEVARWTLGVVVIVCAGGYAVTSSPMFVIGCAVCAAADVSLVLVAARRARRELDEGRVDAVAPVVMFAGRLLVKAGLLVLALLSGSQPLFWGAIAGVIAFDATLAFGGSLVAIRRGIGPGTKEGEHHA